MNWREAGSDELERSSQNRLGDEQASLNGGKPTVLQKQTILS
jgi:hypothetical protein